MKIWPAYWIIRPSNIMARIFPPLREEYEGRFSRNHVSQKDWGHYCTLIPSSPSPKTFYLLKRLLVKMFILSHKIPLLQNFKFQQRGKMFKCLLVAKVLTLYFAVNFILYWVYNPQINTEDYSFIIKFSSNNWFMQQYMLLWM